MQDTGLVRCDVGVIWCVFHEGGVFCVSGCEVCNRVECLVCEASSGVRDGGVRGDSYVSVLCWGIEVEFYSRGETFVPGLHWLATLSSAPPV